VNMPQEIRQILGGRGGRPTRRTACRAAQDRSLRSRFGMSRHDAYGDIEAIVNESRYSRRLRQLGSGVAAPLQRRRAGAALLRTGIGGLPGRDRLRCAVSGESQLGTVVERRRGLSGGDTDCRKDALLVERYLRLAKTGSWRSAESGAESH
jgi:hypothetical protein